CQHGDPRLAAVPCDRRPADDLSDLHPDAVQGSARHRADRHCPRHVGGRHRHHGQDGEVRDMNSFRAENFDFARWLPAGVTIADFVALLAGLAVLTAFLGVWSALRGYNAYERRFASIAQRKESLRRSAITSRRERPRLTPAGLMNDAVRR